MIVLVLVAWALGFVLLWRIPLVRPDGRVATTHDADVSVIVPARNEEANLGQLLPSLFAQEPPPREVIVVDDHSDDRTAEVAAAHGAVVLAASAIPDGWIGKPWACWQGAQRARGRILVFLDADTLLAPGALAAMTSARERTGGLLSIQPYHQMKETYERLAAFFNIVTMAGMGIFSAFGTRIAAAGAFGPCLVCGRDDYFATGGHAVARADIVESAAIARAFRAAGLPVRGFGGRGTLSFRMYPHGPRSLLAGFGKSLAAGANAVPTVVLVALICWITAAVSVTRRLITAVVTGAADELAAWGGMHLLYALQIRWMLARIGNFGWWPALLFQIPLLVFVCVSLHAVFQTRVLRRVWWKGRRVAAR